jgi:hypothetical protein
MSEFMCTEPRDLPVAESFACEEGYFFERAHSNLNIVTGKDESRIGRGEFGGRHGEGLWCFDDVKYCCLLRIACDGRLEDD